MQKLNVFLNGKRNYVQGTQLISRVVDMASAEDPAPWQVKAATFQQITNRTVLATLTQAKPSPNILGNVQLCSGIGTREYSLYSGPEIAPRLNVETRTTWHEEIQMRSGGLSTTFEIEGICSGEDYLVSVVQIVKRLHETLADDVSDVWFTGLRRANIPFAHFPVQNGRLQIVYKRSMKSETGWQTLMQTTLKNTKLMEPVEAAITFFFKSDQFSHVN